MYSKKITFLYSIFKFNNRWWMWVLSGRKMLTPFKNLPTITINISKIGREKRRIKDTKFIELNVWSFKKIKALVDKQKPKKFEPQSPIM